MLHPHDGEHHKIASAIVKYQKKFSTIASGRMDGILLFASHGANF